ncbi:hypothetical protein [Saccharopolyspora griseoalba]|uniref:Uncharacterized protein n=1 Tax=Saccharopolyspora griseoalba TaxID=1431848 RepID=A0ABW2LEW7_9PSEU
MSFSNQLTSPSARCARLAEQPGSTITMHRQLGAIRRIDYQLDAGEEACIGTGSRVRRASRRR